MHKITKADQSGFTLVEVLVVVGILAILLAITLVALNPTQHFQSARDTQRASDVTAILDGIYEYEAANKGSLPPSVVSVSSSATEIGNGIGQINPCPELVPAYLADLPLDPGSGSKDSSTVCGSTNFDTGYQIAKSTSSNRFTISAPSAEGSTISVTR